MSHVGDGAPKVRNQIGWNSSAWFRKDPRAMAYTAAKYTTVAGLIKGAQRVLEIGCGDGFGLQFVGYHVGKLTAIDINSLLVSEAMSIQQLPNTNAYECDFLTDEDIVFRSYDAVYCLDVLEHIDPLREYDFLTRVRTALSNNGVFVCGMPTLNSQEHASDYGRAGHINCQHPEKITATLKDHFANVFSFGLADGQINLGFEPMRQYQLNLCAGPRK